MNMKLLFSRVITFSSILLLIASTFIINFNSTNAATAGCLISTMSLDQYAQTADVSPGSTGTVEFTGSVSYSYPYGGIVRLLSKDPWNSSIVTPNELEFSNENPHDKPFRVTVYVPTGTSVSDVGYVIVKANITFKNGSTGSVMPGEGIMGKINIEQYYNFSVASNGTEFLTSHGIKEKAIITITNNGNGLDTYSIKVDNNNYLRSNGIKVSLSSNNASILENQSETIEIMVETQFNIYESEYYNILINVSSDSYYIETGKNNNEIIDFKLKTPINTHLQFFISGIIIFIVFLLALIVIFKLYIRRKKITPPVK